MQKIIILIFFLTGTAFAQESKISFTINAANNGNTFKIKKGNSFNAVFRECVACASVYEVEKIDTTKIQLVSTKYSNRSCTNCMGGNQDVTFLFKAGRKGKSVLSFAYFNEVVSVTIKANQKK